MDIDRLLNCLRLDGPRLAAIAHGHLEEPVAGCPGWSVRDLVLHVAEVYQHKVATLRAGKPPAPPWPPDRGDIEPIAHLRASYDALIAELTSRPPEEPAWVWAADPATGNVAWWIRRMAQETAVHRWDAEQAAGAVSPIDSELAVDGVDEFIGVFLGTTAASYFSMVAPLLASSAGEVIEVRTGGRSWSIALHPDRLEFDPAGEPSVVVSGEPEAVLLWLWGRLGLDSVDVAGEHAPLDALRRVCDAAG